MEREWPANTAAELIALIDDPRHRMSSAGTARLTAEQTKAILDLRLQRLTALGRDEIRKSSTSSLPKSATISTSCARAPASSRSSRTS